MIKIKNVSKKYKSKRSICTALSDINLEMPSKGFIALTGENGCGKTTLLNLIATIDNDFEGEIFIDDFNVRKDKDEIRTKIISYVFQENFFVNNLLVQENLYLGNIDDETIDLMLSKFSLLEKSDKYPTELSGGQKQRFSLIRGLVRDFEILLVDEPTSSMDEEMELQTFRFLKEVSKEKLVILVSHNKSLVSGFCDIIIKLSNGNLEYIKNNSNIANVKYEAEKIIFDNEININSIDKNKLIEMYNEYNKIVLLCNKNLKNENEYDYTIREHIHNKNSFSLNKKAKKSIFGSLFKSSLLIIVLWTLFTMIQLVITESMIDFYEFDDVSFAYNTITKNNERFTNVEYSYDYYYEKSDLSDEDLIDLFERDNRLDIVKKTEFLDLGFDPGLDYNCRIYTINYTNFKNCELIVGKIPTTSIQYVITDYVADSLLKYNPSYKDYNDILEKGINFNGYLANIVGIMDTNYEDYHLCDDEDVSEIDSNNGVRFVNIMFSSIYINKNLKDTYVSGLNYSTTDHIYYDIVYQDNLGLEECYINKAYFDSMENEIDENEIKTYYGYFNIKKVIDDNNPNPTIYISKQLYSWKKTFLFSYYDSINITIDSMETMELIQNSNLRITSYSGSYISRLTGEIRSLDTFFLFMYYVSLIFIFVLSVLIIIKKMNSNRELYVTMRMNGITDFQYNLYEGISIVAFALTACIVNIGMYYLSYKLLNNYLFLAFGCSINLFNNHIDSYLITIGSFVVVFIVAYLLMYFKRRFKNLIKLVK